MTSEFSVSIFASETPLDPAFLDITTLLPSGDFAGDYCLLRHAPSGALLFHNPDFQFRHVEPAGMLGSVVKFDPR